MNDAAHGESFSAFTLERELANGQLPEVAVAASAYLANHPHQRVLILQNSNCQIIDLDLSGDPELLRRKASAYPIGIHSSDSQKRAGKAESLNLLPRHWDWLAEQPGTTSATLRRLIDRARRDPVCQKKDHRRRHQNLTYRFCQALCGDCPNYEEALRALYAADQESFEKHTKHWPEDFANRARQLAAPVWPS